ncbi:unnamed protein product [marine sediment metagenome]|uniref:Uncharacterized protein n=1 Tax=marine sediment metagenome TaxID=412755 RepID=X1SYM1_9ZZZZ
MTVAAFAYFTTVIWGTIGSGQLFDFNVTISGVKVYLSDEISPNILVYYYYSVLSQS